MTTRPGELGTRGVRRRRRWAALLLATGLVAAGCGDDDGGSADPEPGSTTSSAAPGSTTAPTTAGSGDRCEADTPHSDLTMGTAIEATSLDPTVSRGTGVTGGTELISIYDSLMRWNPDTQEFEPRMATKLEPNDDYTEWTLTLRDGIRFGNGDPLDAAAVKASIERFQVPDSKSRWASLSRNIASMATPDDRTVVFTLTDPWATFPYLMAHEIGMPVNVKVVEQLGAEAFGRLPKGAGAGPFEPVSFAPGEGIVMDGKDDYWGGPVCIDRLRFVTIPGAQGTYDAFKNGELDVAWMRDPKVLAEAKDDGFGYLETQQNAGALLMMNGKPGHPTSDVNVRKAVAHAIDPEVLNQRVYAGTGYTTDAIFGPVSRLYTIDGPSYDPDEAKRLLDAAKAGGYDGRIKLVSTNDPQASDLVVAVEGLLEAVGFDVEVDNQKNTNQMIAQAAAGDFDVVGYGLNIDESSPWMKLDSHLNSKAPANYWGLDDRELDEAILATKRAPDTDTLKAATRRLQERWNEIVPGAIYSTIMETVIWHPEVKGIEITQEANVLLAGAYVEQ